MKNFLIALSIGMIITIYFVILFIVLPELEDIKKLIKELKK